MDVNNQESEIKGGISDNYLLDPKDYSIFVNPKVLG